MAALVFCTAYQLWQRTGFEQDRLGSDGNGGATDAGFGACQVAVQRVATRGNREWERRATAVEAVLRGVPDGESLISAGARKSTLPDVCVHSAGRAESSSYHPLGDFVPRSDSFNRSPGLRP